MSDIKTAPQQLHTRCCIVGGGPAGLMLGLLLARAGVDVTVLEKHGDFFRDFRGDTIHPSTLELMFELGWLDEFLQQPHNRVSQLEINFGDRAVPGPDFSSLPTQCKFIAFMPQWDFLNFIASKAKQYPSFRLLMDTEAVGLLSDNGVTTGVRAKTAQGDLEITADLTVAADGRYSVIRKCTDLPVHDFGVPVDVLWFRIPKTTGDVEQTLGYIKNGHLTVLINRQDYWQMAWIIPKGSLEDLKKKGLEDFRAEVAKTVPLVAPTIGEIDTWDKVKLLTVQVNRAKKWYQPGLLLIGDAAHAMSPAGGVGVNLAIQDAVAAANLLCAKLQGTEPISTHDLAKVQSRREFPVAVTQKIQLFLHHQLFKSGFREVPPAVGLVKFIPSARKWAGRLVGLGVRPEHVRTPKV